MRLKDKVAVITGGNGGIGLATCLLFAQEGAKIVVVDIKEGEAVEKVEKLGGKAVFVKADVSNSEQAERTVQSALRSFQRIDLLFNNAGTTSVGSVTETSEEEWDRVIQANVKSVYLMSHKVVPLMLKQGQGKVINTASVVGLDSVRRRAAYSASKAAVAVLTKQMALDYGIHGITVNAICPGPIMTAMKRSAVEIEGPEVLERLRARTPYPRLGMPEDIANAALYFASDESSFINGHCLIVDGGRMAEA